MISVSDILETPVEGCSRHTLLKLTKQPLMQDLAVDMLSLFQVRMVALDLCKRGFTLRAVDH